MLNRFSGEASRVHRRAAHLSLKLFECHPERSMVIRLRIAPQMNVILSERDPSLRGKRESKDLRVRSTRS